MSHKKFRLAVFDEDQNLYKDVEQIVEDNNYNQIRIRELESSIDGHRSAIFILVCGSISLIFLVFIALVLVIVYLRV